MRALPNRVSVPSDPKLERLLNDILLAVRSTRAKSSNTVRVKESEGGTTYEVIAGSALPGLKYLGDYDPTKSYSVNDIVRKRTGAGSATGAMGIFICVKDAAVGIAPEYPEPADNSVTPGTTYWHTWALGIKAYVGCRNGVNYTTYINLLET